MRAACFVDVGSIKVNWGVLGRREIVGIAGRRCAYPAYVVHLGRVEKLQAPSTKCNVGLGGWYL